jgi:esterase/lipase
MMVKDTLARIGHSVWELKKRLDENPRDAELRRDFLQFFHNSRQYVEQRNGVLREDRSFLLLQEREAPLCILIHGAGGSPEEMKGLGAHLFDLGYTIYGISLPMSKSSREPREGRSMIRGLFGRRADNWKTGSLKGDNQWSICLSEAEVVLDSLQSYSPNSYLIGFSFGGTIALHLLDRFPVKGAVLISPALFAVRTSRYLVFQALRKIVPAAARNMAPREDTILEFMEMTRKNLNPLKKPLLVIQSSRDPMVSTRGFYLLKRMLDHSKSRLVLLDSDHHVLVDGEESRKVFRLCSDFLRKI